MNSYIHKPRWLKNKAFSIKSEQNFLMRKIVTGFFVLILFIVFLNIFQTPIKNSFYIISSPISSFLGLSGSNVSTFVESFIKSASLKNENTILEQENQKLLAEITLLKEHLRENIDSAQILRNKLNNFEVVLGKNTGLDTINDIMLIDKGSDHGIVEEMPVVSSERVLYGKIIKVYKNFSQVMLISNKNSVVDVNIESTDTYITPIHGAVKGNGNLSVYLDLVQFDAEIKEGDILTTSALDGIFPRDFLVGKITNKNKNDLKPFQTAEVHPFFDAKTIENLFIITNYKKQ